MTHRQPVDLLLVVVEDEPKVDGHDGAVAEQEGGVADLPDQVLDLAQDGESTQVGRQVGHLVVAGNQGRVIKLVTIFFTIFRAWVPHSIEVAYAHLTQRPRVRFPAEMFSLLYSFVDSREVETILFICEG